MCPLPRYAEMEKCAMYVRVSSSKRAEEGPGAEVQLDKCREYAKARGITVVKEYHEMMTGTKINCPSFRRF